MKVEVLILKLKDLQKECGNLEVWIEDGQQIPHTTQIGDVFVGENNFTNTKFFVIQKRTVGWVP